MKAPQFSVAAVIGLAVVLAVGPSTSGSTATVKTARNGLIAYPTGNGEEVPSAIWTIKPDGTDNRRLLRADDQYRAGPSNPVWSPDGKQLLLSRTLDRDAGGTSLWYMPLATRQLTRVPLLGLRLELHGYDWAPDGRHIVVAASRGTPLRPGPVIYTIALGRRPHRAALHHGWQPSWSRDGRYIAFVRTPRGTESREVYVMRPDGTGLRQLTHSNDDEAPTFSPDGRTVAFERYGNPSDRLIAWRTVSVTGANDVAIASWSWDSRFRHCPPRWTPDGKRLVAVRQEDLPRGRTRGDLVTLMPNGTDERVAFAFRTPAFAGVTVSTSCQISWQPRPR